MKKIIKLLFISVLALGLVACSGNDGKQTNTKKITVGFVTDTGGIDDKSFNQTSYEGAKKFAEEANLTIGEDLKYLQSKSESDYIPNLSAFAGENVDIEIAAGFLFANSIEKTADTYPNQKMLIIDVGWLDAAKYPNVQQAVFSEHEGSFLVGVVAGLKAKEAGKDTVGYITGQESETMEKFEAGYEQGVWAVYPECKILRENINDFTSAEKGKAAAQKQFGAGAYIVFHAAGGSGNGVIQEAAVRRDNGEDVWAIGVDTDQYELGKYGKENKSAVLTSMMKRVDVAAYNACKAVAEGTFKGGVVEYTLKDGGVSLPAENPNVDKAIIDKVEEFKQKIISGEITVSKKSTKSVEKPQ